MDDAAVDVRDGVVLVGPNGMPHRAKRRLEIAGARELAGPRDVRRNVTRRSWRGRRRWRGRLPRWCGLATAQLELPPAAARARIVATGLCVCFRRGGRH